VASTILRASEQPRAPRHPAPHPRKPLPGASAAAQNPPSGCCLSTGQWAAPGAARCSWAAGAARGRPPSPGPRSRSSSKKQLEKIKSRDPGAFPWLSHAGTPGIPLGAGLPARSRAPAKRQSQAPPPQKKSAAAASVSLVAWGVLGGASHLPQPVLLTWPPAPM
jgi:hypothetical protein